MAITYRSKHPSYQLKHQKKYTEWLNKVILDCNKTLGEISYTFVTDDEIEKINIDFLGHYYPTDIITFDHSFLNQINGEIFIGVDTVFGNAHEYAKGEEQYEMSRVIVHGLLHLVGYLDSTEEQQRTMRERENFYLNMLEI